MANSDESRKPRQVRLQVEYPTPCLQRSMIAASPAPLAKAPLGGLPAEKGQSATSPQHKYSVGDTVFRATATAAGEYTFIGRPKGG
jgi:hypothetical protein